MKSSEACIKTRSPPPSLPLQGQVTKHASVKWRIECVHDGHVGGPKKYSDFPREIYSIFMQISSIGLVLQHGRRAHTLFVLCVVYECLHIPGLKSNVCDCR